MELTTFVCWVLGFLVFLWIFDYLSRTKNSPPGPFLFPLLGVLPYFITTKFLVRLEEWKKRYGSIVRINIGTTRMVVLHDADLIKAAYNTEELSGRPNVPPIILIAGKEKRGLLASEGAQWEAQRRFALRHLRDFGFGKKSMEGMAQEDITDLIAKFRMVLGQPCSVASRFNMAIVNSLWSITAGKRYDLDDPEFLKILAKLKTAISTIGPNISAFTMDWMTKLAPGVTGWSVFKAAIIGTQDFIQEQIQIHKDTFQEGNFRDYMDVAISEIRKTTDPNSTFYKTNGDKNLLVGSFNLLAAGTETTSSTLTWTVLYLSRFPHIQRKLQDEIERVIGRSRLPSLDDKDAMPYVAAVILEIFRHSSLIPFGIPHRAINDIKFNGYTIIKDTIIVANLYDLHHNKKIWGDPDVFRPERFLASDGKLLTNYPVVAPFSLGKRQCLGETLARNNLFLFITSLFQTFDIKEPIGAPKNMEALSGFFRLPPHFEVIFEERKELT